MQYRFLIRLFVFTPLVLFAAMFTSCNEAEVVEEKPPVTDSVPYKDDADTIVPQPYVYEDADTILLKFDEFELCFPGLNIYQAGKLKPADTVEISPEITSYTDSIIIHIKQKDVAWLQFSEQYKTTLSVNNEGPHIELYDWKNFESDWTKPDSLGPYKIRLKLISKDEASRFQKFTKQELISYLKNIFTDPNDEKWADIIQHPPLGKWTDYYWIGVGERRLLITGQSKSGQPIRKLIIIYPPMGC